MLIIYLFLFDAKHLNLSFRAGLLLGLVRFVPQLAAQAQPTTAAGWHGWTKIVLGSIFSRASLLCSKLYWQS
uniref:Uncharacterized protein n=1 Tax=Arundo donax TaxID=35708 RepID=A0A0A9FT72_ARUDO